MRSNPILLLLKEPQKTVISVLGADGYISPHWYGIDDQVPTWSYVSVHIRGTLRLGDASEVPGVLDRLSANMEERLLQKAVWMREKMSGDVFERMTRQIMLIFMDVETIDGTWKLSQNNPECAPTRAAQNLYETGFGSEIEELARQMKLAELGE